MTISHRDFNQVAAAKVAAKSKREAPFSLRLSFEEKTALKKMAAGEPLGAFIKAEVSRTLTLAKRWHHHRSDDLWFHGFPIHLY